MNVNVPASPCYSGYGPCYSGYGPMAHVTAAIGHATATVTRIKRISKGIEPIF